MNLWSDLELEKIEIFGEKTLLIKDPRKGWGIATLETTGIPGVQVGLGVAYASVRKSAVRGTLNLKYAIPVEVTVSSHEASTRPPRSPSVQNSSQKNSSSLSRVVQVCARDLVREWSVLRHLVPAPGGV